MSVQYVSLKKKSSFISQAFIGTVCFTPQCCERKDKVFAISLPLWVPKATDSADPAFHLSSAFSIDIVWPNYTSLL